MGDRKRVRIGPLLMDWQRRTTMLRSLLSRLAAALSGPDESFEPDLIDHPAFAGMSLRDLADLPFPRHPSRDEDEDAVIASEPPPQEPDALSHAA